MNDARGEMSCGNLAALVTNWAARHAALLRLNGTERGNHLIIPIIIVCECISMADKAVAISISTVSLCRSRYTPWSSAHSRVANLQNSVKKIQRFAENK